MVEWLRNVYGDYDVLPKEEDIELHLTKIEFYDK